MAGTRYLLFHSDGENSYTFINEENSQKQSAIPEDALLVWQVEAESWKIACMKRNEFLGWEPYKPMIVEDADLVALLPRHKHDLDKMPLHAAETYITMLELFLLRITDDDRECEAEIAARELLMKLGAG